MFTWGRFGREEWRGEERRGKGEGGGGEGLFSCQVFRIDARVAVDTVADSNLLIIVAARKQEKLTGWLAISVEFSTNNKAPAQGGDTVRPSGVWPFPSFPRWAQAWCRVSGSTLTGCMQVR